MSVYYAVARGRVPGIYHTWKECKEQVHKYPNARYKKFDDPCSAENFIHQFSQPQKPRKPDTPPKKKRWNDGWTFIPAQVSAG